MSLTDFINYNEDLVLFFPVDLSRLITDYCKLHVCTPSELKLFQNNFRFPSKAVYDAYMVQYLPVGSNVECSKLTDFPDNIESVHFISTPHPFFQDGKWYIIGKIYNGPYFLYFSSVDDSSCSASDTNVELKMKLGKEIDMDIKLYVANSLQDIFDCGLNSQQRYDFLKYHGLDTNDFSNSSPIKKWENKCIIM